MEAAAAAARRAAVAAPLPPDTRRTLSHAQSRAVYDRAAARVRDSESAYGGPAITALLSAADARAARRVFEFGCGSGRLAARLLAGRELAPGAQYVGVDLSPVSIDLARQRLQARM